MPSVPACFPGYSDPCGRISGIWAGPTLTTPPWESDDTSHPGGPWWSFSTFTALLCGSCVSFYRCSSTHLGKSFPQKLAKQPLWSQWPSTRKVKDSGLHTFSVLMCLTCPSPSVPLAWKWRPCHELLSFLTISEADHWDMPGKDHTGFLLVNPSMPRSRLLNRGPPCISIHWCKQQDQAFVSILHFKTVTDIHEFNLTVYLLAAMLVKVCNKPTEKLSAPLPHTLSNTLF